MLKNRRVRISELDTVNKSGYHEDRIEQAYLRISLYYTKERKALSLSFTVVRKEEGSISETSFPMDNENFRLTLCNLPRKNSKLENNISECYNNLSDEQLISLYRNRNITEIKNVVTHLISKYI